ncbi:metallophosphoesterase family protein [Pseudooceanicola sp. 502str34]|uniref:metallophosphoesterase family protein n=1 Tax=Maritimibacter alkaliphilus TaxID=404236 RepID=UPI001C93B0F6|nr:metallophosphoesterase [Maritimibacter alkaliphilus]MBY6089322.1 metallophosphoesterase [Maritimibacter alkaliphilus]
MTFRFLHSSDLHIGRKFASIPQPEDGNIRGRLMEARHAVLRRLAEAAAARQARHVLLAGDTFDTATPSPSLVRQALAAMGEAPEVTWWLLPGNHDNLRDAEPLWDMIRDTAPANVRAVTEPAPLDMGGGATLLPCPVAYRAGGTDPTEALVRMESGAGQLRIGFAHGGITDFTESGDVIAPDRDRSARLDYLALGDWHGRMQVSPRVQYPGSPEQDRFKHGTRGVCLSVTLEDPGSTPQVEEIETGHFLWADQPLPLHPGQDGAAALRTLLPGAGRRDVMLRVTATGWTGLTERAALEDAAREVAPDFAHFELRTGDLGTQYDAGDLDRIDRSGGALRLAAEALVAEAGDEAMAAEDRAAAADALARLYAYVREGAE